jgi:hypothetical protein
MNPFNWFNTEPATQERYSDPDYGNVLFHARVEDAANLYVLVRSHPGRAYVLASMQQVDGGWQTALRLPFGGYRYRYYAEFDGALVYVAPSDVERKPVSVRGFDAVFWIGDRDRDAPATKPGRLPTGIHRLGRHGPGNGRPGSVHS